MHKSSSSTGRSKVARARQSRPIWVVAAMGLLVLSVAVTAQQPGAGDGEKSSSPPAAGLNDLAVKQGKIADKYTRLEQLLIRMSELEATSNPQRAALLKRAAQQSSEKLTRQQLTALVKLLAPPAQLKRAVDEQQQIVADLKALLELLQSENRADRLKSEQARVKDYIKEVERLIRLQQGIQGRTEGGDDSQKLAKDQGQIGDRTGQLAKRIQENEEGSQAPSNDDSKSGSKSDSESPSSKSPGDRSPQSKSGEKSPGEKSPGNKSPGDESPGDKKKSPSEKSPADKQPEGDKSADGEPGSKSAEKSGGSKSSKGSKSGDQKGQKGKSSGEGEPGEPSESEQPSAPPPDEQDQGNPARKRLQAAEERMREAQRKLAESKQKDATAEQEQAREELEKAKAELEQILRQMREEEIERTLAMLEVRFRRMLESQLKIYESTKRLDKTPASERSRDIDIQASKLGFEQGKLAVDADKALLVLREEGSSVAFPETVEMMRDDMQQVAQRLSVTQVDKVTLGIEEEIIQTLEELIAALQKAQQDLKDKKSPPPPMQAQQQDPSQRPLVDQLAELRMIRALQMRVNTRTQRYSRLLENVDDPVGRANDTDLRQSLIKLADLEKRVHEITRNLVLGKNE